MKEHDRSSSQALGSMLSDYVWITILLKGLSTWIKDQLQYHIKPNASTAAMSAVNVLFFLLTPPGEDKESQGPNQFSPGKDPT